MKKVVFIISLYSLVFNGFLHAQCWETLAPYPTSNSLAGLHLVDSNEFYISGISGTFMKFTQAGDRRTQLFPSTNSFLTSILYFDPQHISSGGFIPGGFISTHDSGSNWTNNSLGGSTGIRGSARISSNKGIAVGQNGNYYLTNNKGLTWRQKLMPGASHIHAVQFLDSLNGVAVGFFYTFMKTADGGESWSVDTLQTNQQSLGFFLDVLFVSPQMGFAIGSNGVVMKTTDGGQAWNILDLGIQGISYLRSITRFENNTLVIVGNNGIYRYSNDDGASWQSKDLGNLDFQTIRSKGAFGIIVCTNGEILRTRNNGDKWENISKSLKSDFYDGQFWNNREGLVVGTNNKIIKVSNGGINMQTLDLGISDSSQEWISISRGETADTRFVGGSGNRIIRTTNKGTNWTQMNTPGSETSIRRIWFPSPSRGIAINTKGQVLKSTDSGSNWTQAQYFPNFVLRGLYFKDSLNGLLCGDSAYNFHDYLGKIWKTSDGGESWDFADQGPGLLYDIGFSSPDTGFIVGGIVLNDAYYSVIIKTTDGGITWYNPMAGSPILPHFLYKIKVAGDKGIVVGHQGECYRTNNGGNTWTRVFSSTFSRLYGLDFPGPDTGYAVGYNSTILRYRCEPLWSLVTEVSRSESRQDDFGMSFFPNPSSGDFYFSSWHEIEGARIKVYDGLGRQVNHSIVKEEGSWKLSIPRVPGLYLVVDGKRQNRLVVR